MKCLAAIFKAAIHNFHFYTAISLWNKKCLTRFAELRPCRFQCTLNWPFHCEYWHCQSQQFSVMRADATAAPPSGPAMCKAADFRRTSRLISRVVKSIIASRTLLHATMWCLFHIVHCFPPPSLIYVSFLRKPLTQISFRGALDYPHVLVRTNYCLILIRLLASPAKAPLKSLKEQFTPKCSISLVKNY